MQAAYFHRDTFTFSRSIGKIDTGVQRRKGDRSKLNQYIKAFAPASPYYSSYWRVGRRQPPAPLRATCPSDLEKKRFVDQRIADAQMTPLWYPNGAPDHVEQILELLLD